MIQFFMLKLEVGAACLQPSKFELRIAEEGKVYKMWDLVYKIVQNKYKIMIYFSFSNSVLEWPVKRTSDGVKHKT